MATEFNYKRKDPNEYDSVKTAKENRDKYSTYTASDSVTNADGSRKQANAQLQSHMNSWNDELMSKGKIEAWDKIANRPDFSYDVNGDALYQQYKDQYINQGRMAMMDTMGQAAAMTGGYGNSYAASVGNQAYQGYLQKLNEVVPDLYNMAYNMYQQEGEDLKYAYDVARDEYNTKYGEWADKLGFLQSEVSRHDTNYYNEANLDRAMWESDRSHYTGLYNTALDWATNNENTLYNDAATKYQLDQQKRQADAAEEANRIAAEAKTGGFTKEMTAAEITDQLRMYKEEGDNESIMSFIGILEADGIISKEDADALQDMYVVEKTETEKDSLLEWLKRIPSVFRDAFIENLK